MNKRQLEVEKAKLAAEARELKELKAMYEEAAEQIAKNISITDGKMKVLLENWDDLSADDKSVYQSKIYQKNFQKQLQSQINDILTDLNSGQYKSIDEYLKKCYETGYIGTMYDIAGQGIPIVSPIDQKKVVMAIRNNSKLKKELYKELEEDLGTLQKRIASSISRGIATADSYENIARNIANDSKMGMNNAMRIARTEGHRIHSNSAYDAQVAAKAAGADVVKQWDSTMDGKTRTTHRLLDGQIREVEEPFEMGGMKAMYPSGFDRPEEDINCRCALLQRATWALDEDELEALKEKAKFHEVYVEDAKKETFKKQKDIDLNTFTKKYLKASANPDIMNLYLKNVSKKTGNEGVAVLDSYTSLPDKAKAAFEAVTFDFGYSASACNIKERTIRVGKNATKEHIDHEFGHLVEHELMDVEDVNAYKEYLVEGLSMKDVVPTIFYDNEGKEVPALIVKGDRFISDYQGYLYYDDINDIINSDGSINISCLGEVISEPFMVYCNDKSKLTDKMILDLIERAVK